MGRKQQITYCSLCFLFIQSYSIYFIEGVIYDHRKCKGDMDP